MANANRTKRFYEYGLAEGFLPCGKKNTIADVKGVRVGHATKIVGKNIRTGLTLIDPGTKDLFSKKVPAAVAVGNGYGKMAGISQVEELGVIEAPIALTNTLAVGPVMRGVIDLVLKQIHSKEKMISINAVVGETNDGYLNDIRQNVLGETEVAEAYKKLSSLVAIGNVGAGTGTRAFSWKGGIGTASRVITIKGERYTLGILTQTNYGGSLCIAGVPVGKVLGKNDFGNLSDGGSCMIVVATDAPLDSRQLSRIAKRTFFGLARTGSIMAHGSGDYAIAFSTNRAALTSGPALSDSVLNAFFLAAVECAEESVYDALFAAETMTGRDGNTLEALPKDKVLELLKKSRLSSIL